MPHLDNIILVSDNQVQFSSWASMLDLRVDGPKIKF
jgi:hypothetical protein